MKVRTFKVLNNDIYQVSMYTEEWSQLDLELMVKYSEPEIDLGGSFTVPTFTLPTNLAKIKSDSPFNISFDVNDYANAEAMADRWATEIVVRLTAAIVALRANSDTYGGETVTTI